jgi:hypothetical protein
VPGVAAYSRPWILERLELQPVGWQADDASVRDKELAIGGDKVRQLASFPDVAM